jgi:hypothetical protein
MTTRKDVTSIQRTNDPDPNRHWRAHIRLIADIKWPLPVCGQTTKDGPWCEGYGYTPEAALRATYEAIGRSVVAMTEAPVEAAQQPAEVA